MMYITSKIFDVLNETNKRFAIKSVLSVNLRLSGLRNSYQIFCRLIQEKNKTSPRR